MVNLSGPLLNVGPPKSLIDLILVLNGSLQEGGEEKVLDEISCLEGDPRSVIREQGGEPKEGLFLGRGRFSMSQSVCKLLEPGARGTTARD